MSKALRISVALLCVLVLGVIFYGLANAPNLIRFSQLFALLAAYTLICLLLSALALSMVFWIFRKRRLPTSRLLLMGMIVLAILVVAGTAFVLTVHPFDSVAVFQDTASSRFLAFMATVLTFWAAAASAFVLFAQFHIEETQSPQSAAVLRQVKESEALREFNLWMANRDVARVTFFGSFSAIPGFWGHMYSDSLQQMYSVLAKRRDVTITLIGPDAVSCRKLLKFMASLDCRDYLDRMKKWSVTAGEIDGEKGEETVESVARRYEGLCEHLKGRGARVKLMAEPWRDSAVTFAVASDQRGNPVGSIFFGSPIPRDGLLPGETKNVFVKPSIYVSRREEVGALLINLERLIVAP